MKRILLMGGAGFIGASLAGRLAQRGKCRLTLVDDFSRGKPDETLLALKKKRGVNIIHGDCTRVSTFAKFTGHYDELYMLASVVGVANTRDRPEEIIRINTALIFNTLEWLRRGSCKKVLFASTSECYAGTIEAFGYPVPTAENVPLCIQDITHPRYTYAVTKMLGESGFMNYSGKNNFTCTVVRYHNVYGPRMGFLHVIPQVVLRFLKGEDPFRIYGYGQTRSFNFIEDAVQGTLLAMESEKSGGQIFHIGDDRSEMKIEDLVKRIGSLVGFRGKYAPAPGAPGSVSRRCPDISKARSLLNYRPVADHEACLKKTVEWYVNYVRAGKNVFE